MNIRELIEELNCIPEDTLVVLSRDSEGNSFSPLDGIGYDEYDPEDRDVIHPDDIANHYGDTIKAIVLWPR